MAVLDKLSSVFHRAFAPAMPRGAASYDVSTLRPGEDAPSWKWGLKTDPQWHPRWMHPLAKLPDQAAGPFAQRIF